ncbi:MAG: hypothetical protein HQL15_10470, partial [Candidatus Omnitrophica bacterium]|nr:hypothetical protein [Candidatus Omnitrophota bacterium]
STGALDVNGNVILSSGSLIAPSGLFTVSGDWTTTAGFTFVPGGHTVTFDGTTHLTSAGIAFDNVMLGNGSAAASLILLDEADIDGILGFNNSGGPTTLDITNQTLRYAGSVLDLTYLDTLYATGSTLFLDGVYPQTLILAGKVLNRIVLVAPSELNLAGPFVADSLLIPVNGTVTTNGYPISLTGDLFLAGNLNADSSVITVDGNIISQGGQVTGTSPTFLVQGYIGTLDAPVAINVTGQVTLSATAMKDLVSIAVTGNSNFNFTQTAQGFVFVNGAMQNHEGQVAIRALLEETDTEILNIPILLSLPPVEQMREPFGGYLMINTIDLENSPEVDITQSVLNPLDIQQFFIPRFAPYPVREKNEEGDWPTTVNLFRAWGI